MCLLKLVRMPNSEFIVVSSPGQVLYNWCFNNQSISADNADYRGAKTNELIILKSLSKHCGSYKRIVTDKSRSDMHIPLKSAELEIGKFFVHVDLIIIIYNNIVLLRVSFDGKLLECSLNAQMEPKLKLRSPISLE